MPIYEYVCPDCATKFELLRSFRQADEAAVCPRCEQTAARTVSACAAFSKDDSGLVTSVAGTGDACGGCSSTSCSTCGS